MAVVLIIMAVITFMLGFVFSPGSAMQQTVQYLVYVCASVMLSCGLLGILISNKAGEIISAIENASKNKEYSKSQESSKPINSGDSWTCKSCGTVNKNTDNTCKDCGKYR